MHEAIGLLSALTVLSEDLQFTVKHASFQAALMIQMYVYVNVCQKQCLYIMFVFTVVRCQETETSSDITSIPIYEAAIG